MSTYKNGGGCKIQSHLFKTESILSGVLPRKEGVAATVEQQISRAGLKYMILIHHHNVESSMLRPLDVEHQNRR